MYILLGGFLVVALALLFILAKNGMPKDYVKIDDGFLTPSGESASVENDMIYTEEIRTPKPYSLISLNLLLLLCMIISFFLMGIALTDLTLDSWFIFWGIVFLFTIVCTPILIYIVGLYLGGVGEQTATLYSKNEEGKRVCHTIRFVNPTTTLDILRWPLYQCENYYEAKKTLQRV